MDDAVYKYMVNILNYLNNLFFKTLVTWSWCKDDVVGTGYRMPLAKPD